MSYLRHSSKIRRATAATHLTFEFWGYKISPLLELSAFFPQRLWHAGHAFTSLAMSGYFHPSSIIEDAFDHLVRACLFYSFFLPILWWLLVDLVKNAGLISIAEHNLDFNLHDSLFRIIVSSSIRLSVLYIQNFYFTSDPNSDIIQPCEFLLDGWHWMISDLFEVAGFILNATSSSSHWIFDLFLHAVDGMMWNPGSTVTTSRYNNKSNSWCCIDFLIWNFVSNNHFQRVAAWIISWIHIF
jgi:hypothetical protein